MKRLAVVPLLLLASHALAAGPPAPPACQLPPRFVAAPHPFDALRASIAARKVNVLAVGSAATAAASGESFPARMLAALRVALPRVDVSLTVRGGRGMTAEQLLPLLREALRPVPPAVVLWQTGTVEAVHSIRPSRMRAALRSGLEAVRAAGASLVLIDPEFTRAFRANADVDPYEAELVLVAALPGASLFHRYDLTRGWVLSGQIDPERAPKEARAALVNRLNACLGEALARYLLSGAGVPPA